MLGIFTFDAMDIFPEPATRTKRIIASKARS